MFRTWMLFLVGLLLSPAAFSDYYGGVKIKRMRVHAGGLVYFGTDPKPPNTCSLWGEYFYFDTTTPAGKSMFSTLVAAKAADKLISVWYAASSAPDTNQETGCTGATLSVLNGISLN